LGEATEDRRKPAMWLVFGVNGGGGDPSTMLGMTGEEGIVIN
jgi:hypothetical protein